MAKAKAKKKNLASDGVMTVIIIASALQFARRGEETDQGGDGRECEYGGRDMDTRWALPREPQRRRRGDSQLIPLEIEKGREIECATKPKEWNIASSLPLERRTSDWAAALVVKASGADGRAE